MFSWPAARFSAQFAKATGGRHRLERGSERQAFEAAKKLVDDMRDPERHAQQVDRETAERVLAEHKIPLTVAVQDYARRVLSITNPMTVAACAEQYLKKRNAIRAAKTTRISTTGLIDLWPYSQTGRFRTYPWSRSTSISMRSSKIQYSRS
jgi:hypothetical protein